MATTDFSTAASLPFYTRLNQLLTEHHFDDFVEGQCQPFYAEIMGRPGLPTGCADCSLPRRSRSPSCCSSERRCFSPASAPFSRSIRGSSRPASCGRVHAPALRPVARQNSNWHLEGDPEGSLPTRDGLSRWARMLSRSQLLLVNDRRSDTRSTRCTPVDIRGSQATRS